MARTVIVQQQQKGDIEILAPHSNRSIVFISHASPEDNPAAAWFATQLTLLGYEVWCDLKNTHGGESEFWLKIQEIIENQAVKFVYILSNTSCDLKRKKGVYKEVQAADNLHIDNFILPVRIESLTRSIPILLNTNLYINAENWAQGLHELVKRLREDSVPRRSDINFEKIRSWWPAIAVEKMILQSEEDEIVSNVLPIKALPKNIHFIKVLAEGNLITDFNNLKRILPRRVVFYAHGDYAVSFACPSDFSELESDITLKLAYVVKTQHFISRGHEETGVPPEIAQNIVTFLVGKAWDGFMGARGLSSKQVGRRKRYVWFVRDALLQNNKVSVSEPGKRRVSIKLVGSFTHFRKNYKWHVGLFATVDIRLHYGIVLNPKVVVCPNYDVTKGETPLPIDDRKVRSKVDWWNKQWRQKLLAMLSWLSEGQPEIVIAAGSQQIILASAPQCYVSALSYGELSDDDVINQTMEVFVA